MPRKAARPALIVLDMINRFDFDGGAALARRAVDLVPRIAVLRQRFDAAKAPVIYVNDNFADWRCDFGDLLEGCRGLGGASARIAERLAPRVGDYHVLKPRHSAFLGTPLDMLLQTLNVRRLVLTGLAADACILATAQDAKMREFEVWVPGDAVAAVSPQRKAAALKVMRVSMMFSVATTRSVPGLFPETFGD